MTKSDSTKSNYPQKLVIVFGVLFFTYTCVRAHLLSITWDEAFSYLNYISRGIFWLDRFELMSANNHVLNSLGGIVFTKLFGLSEFSLRMGSLIAHLFFLYYSAKLVLTFDNKWIALSGFLILNANPYLLDFFSLARGYGLSLGFMMASIYYLYQLQLNEYKTKHIFFAIVFAELSVLGNLTMLIYFLALLVIIFLLLVYNHHKNNNRIFVSIMKSVNQLILPGSLVLIFLYFVIPYSFELKNARALFMGGDNGFWQDSVDSIVPRIMYSFESNCKEHTINFMKEEGLVDLPNLIPDGGTCTHLPLVKINENINKPDKVILLTDGQTSSPETLLKEEIKKELLSDEKK
jgi:hypothetical protein